MFALICVHAITLPHVHTTYLSTWHRYDLNHLAFILLRIFKSLTIDYHAQLVDLDHRAPTVLCNNNPVSINHFSIQLFPVL